MTHWIADSLTLWKSPLTDARLYTAAAYYSLLSKMTFGMAGTVVAVVTIGFMGLLLSAQDGEAGNLMFDGASLCQYYLFSVVRQCMSSCVPPDSPLWVCGGCIRILGGAKASQICKSDTICCEFAQIPSSSSTTDHRDGLFSPHMRSLSHWSYDTASRSILGRGRRR
jgi:hypothetical protein